MSVSHSDNIDYIVMELIEASPSKQYMEQKGTLNWRETLHFATQIAKARSSTAAGLSIAISSRTIS